MVKFLLRQEAKPGLKDSLAVRIAIKKRDPGLVRMLIERDPEDDFEFIPSDACRNLSESDSSAGNGRHAEAAREVELRRKRKKIPLGLVV